MRLLPIPFVLEPGIPIGLSIGKAPSLGVYDLEPFTVQANELSYFTKPRFITSDK